MKSDEFSVTCNQCGIRSKNILDEEKIYSTLKDRTFYLECKNCNWVSKYALFGSSAILIHVEGEKYD